MRNQFLMFILLIFFLSGCASNVKNTGHASKYEMPNGISSNSVINSLGRPSRDLSKGSFRALSYCTTGTFTDDLVDYFFKEDVLVLKRIYTNTKGGHCSRFFQPIRWENVEKTHFDLTKANFNRVWKSTVYNIDTLKITLLEKKSSFLFCNSGKINRLIVEGAIGPDSSFAVERLLEKISPCTDKDGKITHTTLVSLKSQGGFLKDGYSLGRTLRKFNATTIIENDALCASSCAVAFLGGTKRSLEDNANILFHAPYLKHNSYQMEPSIECTKDKTLLDELEAYYIEMIGLNDGKRIFDRTMWYCSTEDGWVVTGENAAKLYGIASQ